MPSTKRARPGFDPPRPKKKDAHSTSKARDSERPKKKRSRPSTENKQLPSRRSDTASNDDSVSVISNDAPSDAESNIDPTISDGGSPEPEYILAEVVEEPPNEKDNMLSLPLLHRIMQEHFQDKEKMKVTADARQLVGKYVEVYVREAIMRSAYERNERDKENGSGGTSSGWLEVEDLERIAPQLCLDF